MLRRRGIRMPYVEKARNTYVATVEEPTAGRPLDELDTCCRESSGRNLKPLSGINKR